MCVNHSKCCTRQPSKCMSLPRNKCPLCPIFVPAAFQEALMSCKLQSPESCYFGYHNWGTLFYYMEFSAADRWRWTGLSLALTPAGLKSDWINGAAQSAALDQMRPHLFSVTLFDISPVKFNWPKVALHASLFSPCPSPYFALWAQVMPPRYPSSRHTTLASLRSTSSSQTVPHKLLCSTSTRPSLGSLG